MSKNRRLKNVTYYAVYKYNEYEYVVEAEVSSEYFCAYFKENTFQKTYKKVDTFFRAFAMDIKNDTSTAIPKSVKLEEIQSKFKATDGYKFSKLIINLKTGELTHIKLDDFGSSSEDFHINDMENQDAKIIPFCSIKK